MASFWVYTFTYGCAQAKLKSYIKMYIGLLNFLEDSVVVSRWDLQKKNVSPLCIEFIVFDELLLKKHRYFYYIHDIHTNSLQRSVVLISFNIIFYHP